MITSMGGCTHMITSMGGCTRTITSMGGCTHDYLHGWLYTRLPPWVVVHTITSMGGSLPPWVVHCLHGWFIASMGG